MKLYNSLGLNPHVVRMFLAEKGIGLPIEQVDVIAGENRQEAHLRRNPHGQTSTLERDDGDHLSEILPIREYLEALCPEPPLIGSNPFCFLTFSFNLGVAPEVDLVNLPAGLDRVGSFRSAGLSSGDILIRRAPPKSIKATPFAMRRALWR